MGSPSVTDGSYINHLARCIGSSDASGGRLVGLHERSPGCFFLCAIIIVSV